MPRPKKSIEDTWYDCFNAWDADDQRAALKVLEQLHRVKLREEKATTKPAPIPVALPDGASAFMEFSDGER